MLLLTNHQFFLTQLFFCLWPSKSCSTCAIFLFLWKVHKNDFCLVTPTACFFSAVDDLKYFWSFFSFPKANNFSYLQMPIQPYCAPSDYWWFYRYNARFLDFTFLSFSLPEYPQHRDWCTPSPKQYITFTPSRVLSVKIEKPIWNRGLIWTNGKVASSAIAKLSFKFLHEPPFPFVPSKVRQIYGYISSL